MPRIAHISDLHLQSEVPERQAQVEPILKAINDAKPDLVVISGDVTDDGWDSIDELRWAKGWLGERIGADWLALPGNHDVGNFASLKSGVVQAERIDQWERVFGDLTPIVLDSWVVIGLNSMLNGSGLVAETDQSGRLDGQVAEVRDKGQHLAVFLHSPIYVEHVDEPEDEAAAYWLGPSAARHTAWSTLQQADVKLIGCGHVHQTRLTQSDGVSVAWAPPASGTWVHAPGLPNEAMPEQTGFFLHTLTDDGRVASKLVEVGAMLKLYEHKP